MMISEETTKNLGNAELFLRSSFGGLFFNWSTRAWDNADSSQAKVFLSEQAIPGNDSLSAYEVTITPPPNGPWPLAIVRASTGKTLFKGQTALYNENGYIMSAPQTAVTVNPGQVLGGALQSILPIHATATIAVPQGDAYPIPWAIGSDAAKSGAKFFFVAGAINREITIADPATVAGMIVLTTAETATIRSYAARVLRVDADGVSNPLTVWQGKLNVVSNVG